MLEVLVAALLSGTAPNATLRGTARESETGAPIAGALIEVLDTGQRTWSDSAGAYALTLGPGGTYRLRVSCLGYEARTFDVVVGSDDTLSLDIALTPRAVVLRRVAVLARASQDAAAGDTNAPLAYAGARRFDHAAVRNATWLIDDDVLRAVAGLASAGGVEPATSLHVRGGSGDQNLVLVDGIPLFNPYHLGGSMSALDPDIVSRATLYPGVAPARHGGALSSVVSLRTDPPDLARTALTGSLSFTSARLSARGPLPRRTGDFVLSGRHRGPDFLGLTGNQTSTTAASDDAFVRSSLRLGTSSLSLLVFAGRDALVFDARVPDGADSGGAESSNSSLASVTSLPQNELRWRTSTFGAVWRTETEAPTTWELRAWRTNFAATITWLPTFGVERLRSAAAATGLGALVTRPSTRSTLTAGLDVERLVLGYDVSLAASRIHRSATPLLVTVHAEDVWRPIERWSFAAGMRATMLRSERGYLDPRLSVRLTPTCRTAVSLGYARVHQFVQSLRNEESLVDDLVGVGLPIARSDGAGANARGDQVTLAAELKVGPRGSITADTYARRLTGLVLVAPLSARPYATNSVVVGRGRAAGADLSYAYSGERTLARVSYSLAASTRAGAGVSYRPSFAPTHALLAAVGVRPHQTTWLRASALATAGRVASVFAGDLEWAPASNAGNGDDLAGSPEQIIGAVGATRLRPYLRLDVGARQAWRRTLLGRDRSIVLALDIVNVLGVENLSGVYQPRADAPARRSILMSPRRLDLSFRWAF